MNPRADPSVAYQGEPAAYSEGAIYAFFGQAVTPVPCAEFRDVARTVLAGGADYGLLPIENSTTGSISAVVDLLAAGNLEVLGEITQPIHHCLVGWPGMTLTNLRRVTSHPAALAQCGDFLSAHPHLEVVVAGDTAGAARAIAEEGRRADAAIASREAVRRYGLTALAEDIQDRPDNQTRFLVVGRPGARP